MLTKFDQRVLLEIYNARTSNGVPAGLNFAVSSKTLSKEHNLPKSKLGQSIRNLIHHWLIIAYDSKTIGSFLPSLREKYSDISDIKAREKMEKEAVVIFPELRYPQTKLILLTNLGISIARMLKARQQSEARSVMEANELRKRDDYDKELASMWDECFPVGYPEITLKKNLNDLLRKILELKEKIENEETSVS